MRKFEPITRPFSYYMDNMLGLPIQALNEGFVRLVDYMGDEAAVVQAARVSYGKGVETPSKDIGLLRYLMRHRHTTPFEMCEIKLHLRMPIFVARQWIRHRTASLNEISGRYVELPKEFFIAEVGDIAPQSSNNKQGREGGYEDGEAQFIIDDMTRVCTHAFDSYQGFITGPELANELARSVLPLGTYTEFYWKIDLHNLMHFLGLRMDPHAQKEIRDYADIIFAIVEGWLPNITKAFQDYHLESHTFSRQEAVILQEALSYVPKDRLEALLSDLGDDPSVSKREVSAFSEFLLEVPS